MHKIQIKIYIQMPKDKQNLVKLIAAMTSKNRRKKHTISAEDMEGTDDVIWSRMQQKRIDMENKENELWY